MHNQLVARPEKKKKQKTVALLFLPGVYPIYKLSKEKITSL